MNVVSHSGLVCHEKSFFFGININIEIKLENAIPEKITALLQTHFYLEAKASILARTTI